MKKTHIITYSAITLCCYIALTSFIKTSGGHPSSTGAPGEQTCAQSGCHSNASVTTDNTNIVNTLTYSASDSSYVPGQTYSLTLKAKKTGIVKFGFEIVALKTSDNTNIGTWVITDANRTQLLNSGISPNTSRKYITHKTNGTPAFSSGLGQWSFSWTAPSTNVGNIKFYYASNCTNNNAANTGDQLYLSSFQIHPFSGTSMAEFMNEEKFQAILNPALNQLVLNYDLIQECELSVNLFDGQGRIIKKVTSGNRSAGEYSDNIDLSQDISTGIYFVHVNINNQTITKKIMIQ